MSDEPQIQIQSAYQLPPGPERRRMMRATGIVVSCLDYTDTEWAEMEPSAPNLPREETSESSNVYEQ